MTYKELYESATRKLEKSEINLGEYEEMTKPLNEDVKTWIPVSERLPERDTNVLAYAKGVGIVYQRVMWIDDYTGEWVGFVGSGYQDEVIAWMPLPEPYKAESEEDDHV